MQTAERREVYCYNYQERNSQRTRRCKLLLRNKRNYYDAIRITFVCCCHTKLTIKITKENRQYMHNFVQNHRVANFFQRLMPNQSHFTAKWLQKMPKYSSGRIVLLCHCAVAQR